MSDPPSALHQEWLQKLRRREGTWVDWGHLCQQLSKAGWRSEQIFAETGIEPSVQNRLTVASQVYDSLGDPHVQTYFRTAGSDVLYELRLLSQQQRLACAQFIAERRLDANATRDVVKALKELSQYRVPPQFSDHPGDAVAFQCWRLLRQKPNSPERVRLLSRGLSFAHTETARSALEQLLDPNRTAPLPTPPAFALVSAGIGPGATHHSGSGGHPAFTGIALAADTCSRPPTPLWHRDAYAPGGGLTGMADFAGCPSPPGPADPSITWRNWHCRTHFARRGPPGYGLAGRTLLFGCRTGTHHLEVVAGTAGKSAFGAIDFGFASPPPVGPRTPHRTLANGRVEMTDARLGHFGARGPVRS
jgi:hypothetical protein